MPFSNSHELCMNECVFCQHLPCHSITISDIVGRSTVEVELAVVHRGKGNVLWATMKNLSDAAFEFLGVA